MQLDLLVRNAHIRTLDPERPTARALGVLNGVVVGLDEDVAGLPARRTLDAGGATVVPGFNDAHCHTAWFGLNLTQLDVSTARSVEDVYAAVAAHAEGLAPDAWVLGAGLDHNNCGGHWPHRDALDRAAGGQARLDQAHFGARLRRQHARAARGRSAGGRVPRPGRRSRLA